MAISPPSDIVLDVARAIEPANIDAARARLAQRSGAAAVVDNAFSISDMRNASAPEAKATPETFVKFEAMVLQQFIQSMLPKDAGAVYGNGMAGDMWQSLLSQQLGDAVAKRGGIGIADSILRDHYFEGETKVALSGVSAGPEKAEIDRQSMLSTALVQEMQRKLTKSLAEDASASLKP
ncbi:Rod binding protein [Mesorhizobium albiziae]|uniref:Rod binding protein n=1 Tax=Neomesorhizobium albiziae TaxID=335020 RepID=A0A1I4DN77_9HYPH|nr:rod-binding protein [Mesorhizobium albiziae]GLS31336.1 flagellar protein FlgJ [Mesorhizobium albiziae]SFK93526.1 Rod binding protein [Mesorhizobium albiziae]